MLEIGRRLRLEQIKYKHVHRSSIYGYDNKKIKVKKAQITFIQFHFFQYPPISNFIPVHTFTQRAQHNTMLNCGKKPRRRRIRSNSSTMSNKSQESDSQWGPNRKLRAPIGTHEKDPDGRSLPHTPRKIREIFRSPRTSESEDKNKMNGNAEGLRVKFQNSRRMSVSENCLHKIASSGIAPVCPRIQNLKRSGSDRSSSSENLFQKMTKKFDKLKRPYLKYLLVLNSVEKILRNDNDNFIRNFIEYLLHHCETLTIMVSSSEYITW